MTLDDLVNEKGHCRLAFLSSREGQFIYEGYGITVQVFDEMYHFEICEFLELLATCANIISVTYEGQELVQ